jgi:hypothetical protein
MRSLRRFRSYGPPPVTFVATMPAAPLEYCRTVLAVVEIARFELGATCAAAPTAPRSHDRDRKPLGSEARLLISMIPARDWNSDERSRRAQTFTTVARPPRRQPPLPPPPHPTDDDTDAPKGAAVTVLKAAKACFNDIVEVSGTVIAREETMVRPRTAGVEGFGNPGRCRGYRDRRPDAGPLMIGGDDRGYQLIFRAASEPISP